MLHCLQILDQKLFLVLNRGAANPILDAVMPFITDADHWKIPIIIIWLYLMIFCGRKGRITGIGVIFLIALSDQVCDSLLKPWVHRLRPCHPDFFVEGGRFLIGMKKSLSFPSCHATNMGAMATYFSIRHPKTRWIVIPIALLIAYSRVYVGVHYVFDVLAGLLLGIGCGAFILKAVTWIGRAWQYMKSKQSNVNPSDSKTSANFDQEDGS